MVLGSFLGSGAVNVKTAYNIKAVSPVSRKVAVINYAATADNSYPIISFGWQCHLLRNFVIPNSHKTPPKFYLQRRLLSQFEFLSDKLVMFPYFWRANRRG